MPGAHTGRGSGSQDRTRRVASLAARLRSGGSRRSKGANGATVRVAIFADDHRPLGEAQGIHETTGRGVIPSKALVHVRGRDQDLLVEAS